MNLEVVAEGKETEPQFEFLRAAGCQLYQGYLFGRPCPPEKFKKVLAGNAKKSLSPKPGDT